MPLTDPIGDLLTRIRNAQSAGHSKTEVPKSKLKSAVLEVLLREGYIRGHYDAVQDGFGVTTVELKERGTIKSIQRVSTPGRRVYAQIKTLPRVANGLGIAILSTPRGVMSDNEARAANVGGEVLCHVF